MPSDFTESATGRQPSDDAARWDSRYRDATISPAITPPELVVFATDQVSAGDRALDIACGLGDGGLYLAQLGADVTFADVSRVALDLVEQRATATGLDITTIAVDFLRDPPPDGPFDVISCAHYLDRALLTTIGEHLAEGGRLFVAIATATNLERHERPSARFLLNPGELPTLVPDLHVIHHDEGWRSNGVHEAWLIAERRA